MTPLYMSYFNVDNLSDMIQKAHLGPVDEHYQVKWASFHLDCKPFVPQNIYVMFMGLYIFVR